MREREREREERAEGGKDGWAEGCDVTSLKSVLVTHTKRREHEQELCRILNFRIRE